MRAPHTPHSPFQVICKGDPAYPARLAERLTSFGGAPNLLWQRGRYAEGERAVAVVGARAASRPKLELARAIGATLAKARVQVISGGALGVDAAAHEGALHQSGVTNAVQSVTNAVQSGVTIAVLGTGIDVT